MSEEEILLAPGRDNVAGRQGGRYNDVASITTGTFSQTYGSILTVILHINDVPCCFQGQPFGQHGWTELGYDAYSYVVPAELAAAINTNAAAEDTA